MSAQQTLSRAGQLTSIRMLTYHIRKFNEKGQTLLNIILQLPGSGPDDGGLLLSAGIFYN
jgi:hypothetical protein